MERAQTHGAVARGEGAHILQGDVNSKPFWQSKTFWVNIISLVLVMLAELVRPEYGLPANVLHIIALVTPMANTVLRFLAHRSATLTLK